MELTKEELQKRIDHYTSLSEMKSNKTLCMFYLGKAEAYIDLYNELYPEMEGQRAFPLKVAVEHKLEWKRRMEDLKERLKL